MGPVDCFNRGEADACWGSPALFSGLSTNIKARGNGINLIGISDRGPNQVWHLPSCSYPLSPGTRT